MPHRPAEQIIVDLNQLHAEAIADQALSPRLRRRLCALRREIEDALDDPALTQDQRRDYDDAYQHWDAIYKAIFRESEILGNTRECCENRSGRGNAL
jgi:hypothetical protein